MAVVPGVGSSSVGSGSTVSKEEEVHHPLMEEGSDESELELGLGLSIGIAGFKNYKQVPRILTAAEDLVASSPLVLPPSPSSASSSCSSLGFTTSPTVNSFNSSGGTKRASSPTAASQVVGWPPIRAYRMNNMANQSKSIATGENFPEFEENKGKDTVYGAENKGNPNPEERVPVKNSLLVKVNMDGVAIGRKVNLSAHSSYELLAQTLEYMFTNDAVKKSSRSELVLLPKVTRPSKLLNGSSEYVLTYEDKDGDWMLVGDVPWGMFLNSVKRLRITRTSEANGLAPRSEERRSKQRSRPT